ncbi:hypothetical protein ACFWBB_11925 [Streptomyces sp. NPDC060000]|uniref:hypothetical protein n=1 Tax=Streptomyces sp. NPDC060000 TaxID=3347031 RepID=UPI003682CB0D
MLARFLRETAADVVMPAGRYTLLDRSALDDALAAAVVTGKGIVAVGVFNSGLPAHDRPTGGCHTTTRTPSRAGRQGEAIAGISRRHGTSLSAAAIAFPFAHPAVVNVTLGMADPEQVTRNVRLHRQPVPRNSGAIYATEG